MKRWVLARWQSGHAVDCKSIHLGSTPGRASSQVSKSILVARVVKSVDTRDLKSLDRKVVRVQVSPRAPFKTLSNKPFRKTAKFPFQVKNNEWR